MGSGRELGIRKIEEKQLPFWPFPSKLWAPKVFKTLRQGSDYQCKCLDQCWAYAVNQVYMFPPYLALADIQAVDA
ncbi:hypothetical protein L6164_006246 [Bauhinia variegata]|uniref:Uncharacterized protein n=1 Tax=Bauhinia variegata TaxID=167791 RepID=A0ACB9PTU7_BAUVA|nr:hypothetical protein L6164_006246 [Bauhinia variegata]